MGTVTCLIDSIRKGDACAVDRLMNTVYRELHQLAVSKLAFERPDHTLQATALVDEVVLRLRKDDWGNWKTRTHSLACLRQLAPLCTRWVSRYDLPVQRQNQVRHKPIR